MIQILLIHQHFYPEPSGTAKSSYEIAKYFCRRGYEINVITEFPNRNFESSPDKNKKLKKYEIIDGIKVYRLRNRFKYSRKPIQRLLAYLSFTIKSFLYGIKLSENNKTKIILTIQAIPSALPGCLLSKIFRQKHIFYCTDMMPDLGIVSGMIKNKIIIKSLNFFEKITYINCNAIFAVTEMMAEEIKTRTTNPNVFVLPDWMDDNHYNTKKNVYLKDLVNQYALKGKKVLLYIGNIGFLQNIGVFVELAKKIQNEPSLSEFIFIIGGVGVEAQELKKKVEQYKLDNIKFIGIVDRNLVPSFLKLSNILLMNFLDHPHLKLYRSSKIFDYIIAEKPVLIGASGELKKLVLENNLGKISRPSNVNDFHDNLLQMKNQVYDINNHGLINKYNLHNVLSDFEKKLNSLGII